MEPGKVEVGSSDSLSFRFVTNVVRRETGGEGCGVLLFDESPFLIQHRSYTLTRSS